MAKIDRVKISSQANNIRKEIGEDLSSPINIFRIIDSIPQMTLVYQPFSENVSGIYCREEGFSVIAINSAMTKGRQAFSISHELYHHFFDEEFKQNGTVVCLKNYDKSNDVERKADIFASYFLVPQDGLYAQVHSKNLFKGENKLEDIIYLEQFFGTSHLTMLIRLYEEDYITDAEKKKYEKESVIKSAALLGYDTSLYKPSIFNEKMTYGYYINLAGKLKANELISENRYKEYLTEAYRDDIVNGFWKEIDTID